MSNHQSVNFQDPHCICMFFKFGTSVGRGRERVKRWLVCHQGVLSPAVEKAVNFQDPHCICLLPEGNSLWHSCFTQHAR